MGFWNTDRAVQWMVDNRYNQRNEKTEKTKSVGFDIPGAKLKQVAFACGRQAVVSLYINATSTGEVAYPLDGIQGIEIKKTYRAGHVGENGNPGIAGSVARNNPSLHPENNEVYLVHVADAGAMKRLIDWYTS
jgi:hypothetical protein